MPDTPATLTDKAKSADYVLRSVISGVLALMLVGAVVYCAIAGISVSGELGSALLTGTGVVIGFFFGNHASVNGSMLASISNRRASDAGLPNSTVPSE